MCCKGQSAKIFAAFLIAFTVLSFAFSGDGSSNQSFLRNAEYGLIEISRSPDPLAFLFQIMFILFFISPPIIALLLFLIWRELKNRNKMK